MKLLQEYRGLRKDNYILFIGRLMTSMGSMVMPMMTLILSQKLGLSAETIAVLLFIYSLLGIPLNIIGGKMADHFSKKMVIVYCDLVSILGSFICTILPLSFFSVMLFGFAALMQSMEMASYSALVAEITPAKDRERAYSLNYLGMNLGLVLAPTISGLLFKSYMWLMFLINGIAIASSTVLIYFFLGDTKVDTQENCYENVHEEGGAMAVLKNNAPIVLFIVFAALYAAVYNQYGYLMPLELGRVFGENGAVIFGTVSSVNCIVVVLFTPFITRTFRYLTEIQKMFVGISLITISYVLFCLFLNQFYIHYVVMLIFTWGEIFNTISTDPYMTKRIPASHRGRVISINMLISNLFFGLSQVIVGFIYKNAGSLVTWTMVILTGLLAGLLCIVLYQKDKKTYPELYR